MTAIIEASSGTYRSRVDGTIVLSVEISPEHRAAALALFGMPGTPLAIAALKDGHAAKSDKPEKPAKPKAEPDELKGGALARLAGQWCNAPVFWEWADGKQFGADIWGIAGPQHARDMVCEVCGITSRRALDHDQDAAALFHRHFRFPFQAYMAERGITL